MGNRKVFKNATNLKLCCKKRDWQQQQQQEKKHKNKNNFIPQKL
jgi:hypothetical protein